MGEYLAFIEVVSDGKTKKFSVINKKAEEDIGGIYWHSPWRRYVFEAEAEDEVIIDAECAKEIAMFLMWLMREWKNAKDAERSL